MLEEGMLLYFAPPYLAGGVTNISKEKRIMLIIKKCDEDNTLTLINISKLRNKPNCMTYPYNVLIKNYNPPLPLPSFAKVNNNYVTEIFPELSNYIYKNGIKLDENEFDNILVRQNKHRARCKIEIVSFTKNEFMLIN